MREDSSHRAIDEEANKLKRWRDVKYGARYGTSILPLPSTAVVIKVSKGGMDVCRRLQSAVAVKKSPLKAAMPTAALVHSH